MRSVRRLPLLMAAGLLWWFVGRRLFRQHVVAGLIELGYRRRLATFDAETPLQGETVFLGDSITRIGDWPRLFPGIRVRNLGISGDTTGGVLRRLHHVVDSRPSRIFLLIGTNDLYFEVPREQILANVARILDELRAALPDAEIHVQSIMPRHRRWAAAIAAVNAELETLVAARGLNWIDLWPALSDGSDQIRRSHAHDLLHPSARGYAAWVDVLAPFVTTESASHHG